MVGATYSTISNETALDDVRPLESVTYTVAVESVDVMVIFDTDADDPDNVIG